MDDMKIKDELDMTVIAMTRTLPAYVTYVDLWPL